MKTRENELHEPMLTFVPAHNGYASVARKVCSVCDYPLIVKFGCSVQGAMELYTENYCPRCGARLKEIEK